MDPTTEPTERAAWALAALAIALEVPHPLVDGQLRDLLTVAAVVAFFLATITAGAAARGPRWAAAYAALAVTFGLGVEAVGTRTGRPFGRYDYAESLGPRLLGVPLVVPLAWAMMAYPCAAAARRVARRRVGRVAAAAVGLAGWDLFLDPQMVAAGHWRWRRPAPHLPGVPDVPVGNFVGWLAVAAVLMTAVDALPGAGAGREGPAYALFGWTYASSLLANLVFFRRPWVALWGGLGMGALAVPFLRSLGRRR